MLESNYRNLRKHDEVKFVIADRNDYEASVRTMRKFDIASRATVLFAPVFGSIRPETLVEWMRRDHLPARLNLQLHKLIWGPDAEGV